MNLLLITLLFVTFHCYICEPDGNIFSAVSHMEPLVDIERRLVKIAREYLNQERARLNGVKQFADSVREAMKLSKDEPINYLGNPVNSYLLIKRFTSGWSDLGDRLSIDDKKMEDIKTLLKANEMYLPTFDKDMLGATNAILRLQDTYDVSSYEISEGKINGTKKQAQQFTSQDCIDIANVAHQAKRYVRMQEWLIEAERIITNPSLKDRYGNATKLEVFEFLAWGYYLSNDMGNALKYTNKVLEESPSNPTALENKRIYTWYVEKNQKSNEKESKFMNMAKLVLDAFKEQEYVKACQDENPKMLKLKDPLNLTCFIKNDEPRLILKPIKVTRLHDNPEVYIYHDILSESEMEQLRLIAAPRMQNARVVDPENNDFVEALYRVSKSMWMNQNTFTERQLSRKLDVRFSDITGLSMESAEPLQMNNYGLGGQYEFHHDHGYPGSILFDHENGNRLATLLLYLSDVERGGQTVFTKIGLSLHPKKGDGVFWFNLHRNGTGIWDTEHASCPVVSGSKWVANKWIHMHDNEFRRKCTLNKME